MPITPAKDLVAAANAAVRTVSVEEARTLQERGGAVFVDVREPAEWEKGRVPGAVHVPRGLLEWAADPSNPTHRPELVAGRPLVLYCASAGRSALAAKALRDMGHADVAHVAGGFTAWAGAGHPVEGGSGAA